MNDPHNLQRFIDAQERDYQTALAEIAAGRKASHWMWYIFPQYDGLGFSSTSIVGVAVGLLAGSFLVVNRLIVPVNSFLRYIPPTAFISLLIVYFGIGETYKYAVIFLGVIFFIVQMVIDVVEDIDRRYFEMGLTSGYSNLRVFKEVVVPASWPRCRLRRPKSAGNESPPTFSAWAA